MTTDPKTTTLTVHGQPVEFTSERPKEAGYYLVIMRPEMSGLPPLMRQIWKDSDGNWLMSGYESRGWELVPKNGLFAPLIPATSTQSEVERLKGEVERLRGVLQKVWDDSDMGWIVDSNGMHECGSCNSTVSSNPSECRHEDYCLQGPIHKALKGAQ